MCLFFCLFHREEIESALIRKKVFNFLARCADIEYIDPPLPTIGASAGGDANMNSESESAGGADNTTVIDAEFVDAQ